MNSKIAKLRSERKKNTEKISDLEAKNKVIDETILELENTEIIGLVRAYELTPEQLAELLNEMKQNTLPTSQT